MVTKFQQELIDAAELTEHKWSLMEEHANSTRENIYRQEYLEAKAKFMELVKRAEEIKLPPFDPSRCICNALGRMAPCSYCTDGEYVL